MGQREGNQCMYTSGERVSKMFYVPARCVKEQIKYFLLSGPSWEEGGGGGGGERKLNFISPDHYRGRVLRT